jgi:hypothetical protein
MHCLSLQIPKLSDNEKFSEMGGYRLAIEGSNNALSEPSSGKD